MDIANRPELADRLAAAYALGTLRGSARRRFESLARQAPSIKARVVIWQERMASLAELEPAQAPDPVVWERIDKQLRAMPVPAPATAPEGAVASTLRRVAAWWRLAALGGAVAAVAAAAVGLQLQRELGSREQQLARALAEREAAVARAQAAGRVEYVAVLADERQSHMVLVTIDTQRQTLTLKHERPIATTDVQSLQLWALPPGAPPRSLGVLQDGLVVRMPAPAEQVRGVPALAISLEPRGGAPAGSGPTGPVMVQGALLQAPI